MCVPELYGITLGLRTRRKETETFENGIIESCEPSHDLDKLRSYARAMCPLNYQTIYPHPEGNRELPPS